MLLTSYRPVIIAVLALCFVESSPVFAEDQPQTQKRFTRQNLHEFVKDQNKLISLSAAFR